MILVVFVRIYVNVNKTHSALIAVVMLLSGVWRGLMTLLRRQVESSNEVTSSAGETTPVDAL